MAMIGGILVATALTLLFLPALYVGFYRIEAPPKGAAVETEVGKVEGVASAA